MLVCNGCYVDIHARLVINCLPLVNNRCEGWGRGVACLETFSLIKSNWLNAGPATTTSHPQQTNTSHRLCLAPTFIKIYAFMHVPERKHPHIYAYLCIYLHTYICHIYAHTYMYTHIHNIYIHCQEIKIEGCISGNSLRAAFGVYLVVMSIHGESYSLSCVFWR